MFHEDGRKSALRLVTTMTYRSSHMPIFTMIETANSTHTFRRAQGSQKICTATQLQAINCQ